MKVTILANGEFPTSQVALDHLFHTDHLVICDGGYLRLQASGITLPEMPVTLIGDGDSLSPELRDNPSLHFIRIVDQQCNDLTKAVRHSITLGATEIVILGATGLREDHTLGNLGLFSDYSVRYPEVRFLMVSDYGIFTPVTGSHRFDSFERQQVSLFAMVPQVRVTVSGLEYPVEDRIFTSLWQGTLNAALSDHFDITALNGPILVYQTHDPKAL